MILYEVYAGVVKIKSVVRETNCGWREKNGGFINRRTMRSKPYPSSLSEAYYTTSESQALEWSKILIEYMIELKEIAHASISDVEFWSEEGRDESLIPKSRLF